MRKISKNLKAVGLLVEAEGIFLDHRPGTCGMVSPRRQLRDQQHRSSLPLPRSATVPEIATGTPTAGLTTAALPAAATPAAALPLMGSPSPAAASGTSRTRPFHGTRDKETPKTQHKGTHAGRNRFIALPAERKQRLSFTLSFI